jgi:CubicO group peptidase (beta-lactamase class C family)
MAEAITSRAWEELLRERVLVPLGATTAGVGWPNVRDAQAPWGHMEKDGALVPTPPDDPYKLRAWTAPAGDLSMSLADLSRLARLHLNGVDGKAGLVRPETIRVMHTKRLRGGLGWGVSTLLGHDVSTFSGSAGTFIAMIALVHDADLAVMVAGNAGDADAEAAVKGVLKALIVRFAGDRSPSPH